MLPIIEILQFKAEVEPKHSMPSFWIPKMSINVNDSSALVAKSGDGKSLLLSLLFGYPPLLWLRKGNPPLSWLRKENVTFEKFCFLGNDFSKEDFYSTEKFQKAFSKIKNYIGIYLPQSFPTSECSEISAEWNFLNSCSAIYPNLDNAKNLLKKKFEDNGLDQILKRNLRDLSGGERRRGEILSRIVAVEEMIKSINSDIYIGLFLDEPTSGFDIVTQSLFFNELNNIKNKNCKTNIKFFSIVATHAIEEVKVPNFNKVLFCKKNESNCCELSFNGTLEDFNKGYKNAVESFKERCR